MRLRLPDVDTPAPTATWRDGRYVDVPDKDAEPLIAGGARPVHYELEIDESVASSATSAETTEPDETTATKRGKRG